MKPLIAILLCPLVTWAACPAGFSYYRTITFDHTQSGSTDAANFPGLLNATVAEWKTVGNGGHIQNTVACCANSVTVPADLVFYSDNGTTLTNWDCEAYTASTGAITCWFNVPTLSHTSDTVMYAFYGKAATTTYQATAISTWNSAHKAVWHLNAATSSNDPDSTTTGVTATPTASPTQATGQIDGSKTFNGSSQYETTAATLIVDPTATDMTIDMWINVAAFQLSGGLAQRVLTWQNVAGTKAFMVMLGQGGTEATFDFGVSGASGTQYWTNTTTWTTGAWHHYVATWTLSGAGQLIYIDGSSQALTSTSIFGYGGTDNITYIGNRSGAGTFFDGSLDEVRLSNVARSADWITAEYNMEKPSANMVTIGSEQSCGGSSVPPGQFPRIASRGLHPQ